MAKTDKAKTEDTGADPDLQDSSEDPEKVAEYERLKASGLGDSEARGTVWPESQDQRPLREDLPTNDEPDIPLTAGAEAMFDQPAVLQPVTPPAPRVVEAPRLPDNAEVPMLRRRVTMDDVNSPGFQLLISGAKENFETMVLRPGDRVAGGVEVIGLNNINERIELRPGAVVPEGDTGYVPTNYIMDHQRQRMIHDQAERQVGNRKQ